MFQIDMDSIKICSNINFILVGEEGVGKSSLINTLVKEQRAPVSDMHTKTWRISKYSIQVCDLVLNFFDIPGIEGKYSDEVIAGEISGHHFDVVLCCIDGTRIRPTGPVRKTIQFVKRYIPNTPVIFVVTKENCVQETEKNQIDDVKGVIRGLADNDFKHYGLVSVGSSIPFSRTHNFWQEIMICIPELEKNIGENFTKYQKEHENVCDSVLDFITKNYETIPEIKQRIEIKNQNIKNLRLVYGFLLYAYIGICTVTILSAVECYEFYIAQIVASFFLLIILFTKAISWYYSTKYCGLFPVHVEEFETDFGVFTGKIIFVSKDKYYTQVDGIISREGRIYDIQKLDSLCCCFELCDNSKYENYANLA